MNRSTTGTRIWVTPALLIVALIMVLAMVRLGIWQLDRAQEKQDILNELIERSSRAALLLSEVTVSDPEGMPEQLRFRNVRLRGHFLADKSIFVDRQVVNGRVGYQVFTPFVDQQSNTTIMVSRGWVSAGESRQNLPVIETPTGELSLSGRLNNPPPPPPLWDDRFPVSEGAVWQFLPIEEYASQTQINLFPLVVELAPDTPAPAALLIDWPVIDDQWVAKHRGYAFQWFAMALAFFIACLVLMIRRSARSKQDTD